MLEHLKIFNKKTLDEVWTPLLVKILYAHGDETRLDQAIEMCEAGNNLSTQRVGATILAGLLGKHSDQVDRMRPVLMQYC